MLDAETLALRQAMIPLRVYASETRRTIDLADSRQAKRFAHVQDIEAALNAGADLYERLNPEPLPLTTRVLGHLAKPHMQARLAQPPETRQALATISTTHLPRPDLPA